MAVTEVAPEPERTSVALVDDRPEARVLLRLQFARDPRFEVVGEAADGDEAIVLAERTRPDLMILDHRMPRLGGVEATAEIRKVSPGTAIVLYTATADDRTYQAALAAGALEVFDKAHLGNFVQHLASLVSRAASDATVELHVGPVTMAAARVWVANTKRIIAAVADHPEIVGPIPDDVIALFRSLLDQWGRVAESGEAGDEFYWVARAAPVDVSRIVEHWSVIDSMTDDQLELLGIHWSPPEGEPFFRALTSGVLQALGRHDETRRLAAKLGEQWAYLDSGADSR